jgi:hypothetical protein
MYCSHRSGGPGLVFRAILPQYQAKVMLAQWLAWGGMSVAVLIVQGPTRSKHCQHYCFPRVGSRSSEKQGPLVTPRSEHYVRLILW